MALPPDAPRIVLGVDFSPGSERARDTAIRLAKEWGAHVVLVHALHPLGAPGLDLSHPPYDPERNESADVTATRSGGTLAQAWLNRVRQQVPAELVLRAGAATDVLLAEARRVGARAIVVGSRGSSGLERGVLGSVAQGVLAGARVPVLVVPGRHPGGRRRVRGDPREPRPRRLRRLRRLLGPSS